MSDGKLKRDGDWKVMHNYIAQLEVERDQLCAALDELETEIRRGDNDNCNVDTSHCLAVIANVEALKDE
jgi:hypothetical protein